jgi:tRNA (guanine-N7-)-methyltransferase
MIDIDLDQVAIPLQWAEVFARDAPTEIDIGSGKGKFLNELATARPECNLLAVERAAKYHKLCCDRAAKRGLTNVRVLRTTAEDLLFRLLRQKSVRTFYVLFPDPWPKKRHHKRRLFKPANIAAVVEALEPNGRLLVKSDHEDYSAVIDEVLRATTGVVQIDADDAFAGLPSTGFEHKYQAQGRAIHSFAVRKKA